MGSDSGPQRDSEENGRTLLEVLHGRFPALRSRDFRTVWLGGTISVAGSQMQMAALDWHIYQLTHSPIALGFVGLARVVPIILFSLLGGVVADARDRRRVILTTQFSMALLAVSLGWLTRTGRISAAAIYVITAIGSAVVAFNNPARVAITASLVPREHLPNATSLTSMTFQIASILGPVATGALLARGQLASVYFINAVSFLGMIYAMAVIRPPRPSDNEVGKGEVSLAALGEGLRFVAATPILTWTILLDFLATFFSSANALLPVFASDVLHVGARGYGLLRAAPAIGSVLAGVALASRRTVARQGITVLWAVFLYGGATILFGASPWFWLSWLALAVTGAADTISTILRQTIRQLVTPDNLRGRMTAFNMIFFMGGPQLGELEAGLVAGWIGAPWSVVTGGIGCLIAVIWVALRAHELRAYQGDARAADPDSEKPGRNEDR